MTFTIEVVCIFRHNLGILNKWKCSTCCQVYGMAIMCLYFSYVSLVCGYIQPRSLRSVLLSPCVFSSCSYCIYWSTIQSLPLLKLSLVIWYHMYSFPSLKNLHLASAAYQPSTLLAIRGLVAQQEKPQINWPRAYQKCRTEHAVKTELLNSWCAAMTAAVSRTLSPSCLSQDIVTPILSILTPPTIRPVSCHQFLMQIIFNL